MKRFKLSTYIHFWLQENGWHGLYDYTVGRFIRKLFAVKSNESRFVIRIPGFCFVYDKSKGTMEGLLFPPKETRDIVLRKDTPLPRRASSTI